EAFVRRFAHDDDPLALQLASAGLPRAIVGVAGDIQQKAGWGSFGPVAAIPAAYVPAAQANAEFFRVVHAWFSPSWIVRLSAPQAGVTGAMQRAVASVDPQLPF